MVKEAINLEIFVTPETAGDIESLITEKQWEKQEGLRILLGAGLAAIRTRLFDQDEIEDGFDSKLKSRLMEVEQSLAVLRFQLFEALERNRSWELSSGAIQKAKIGYESIMKSQRQVIEDLRKTVKKMDLEISRLRKLKPTNLSE